MENPSAKKASRLNDIERLLFDHPEGMTQAEIARRLGVNRSTIYRYLPSLPHLYEDDGRLKIDPGAYLFDVRFNLHEALSIHLAARLLATRMDRQNPHAAAALRKLASALETLAPQISRHIQQSADLLDEADQRHDPAYLQTLEALTLAWAEQRKVRVWHHSERTGKVSAYLFSPYFIEPYAVGQTTMLIGLSEPPGAMRTLKIERIERVELCKEPYQIPTDFDPRSLLADAWGIWYSESEPVEVVLKFTPQVAQRVRETRWHRSQQLEDLPNGGLIWRARVAEPKEMLYWIRGWGADCEALSPQNLRQLCREETQKMSAMYRKESSEGEDGAC
jgi:CRISPR-associated endonuclease/helicase Cas3